MYSLLSSAQQVRTACAVVLCAALAPHVAWGQQDTAPAAQTLAAWLGCEYCDHGELAAVTRNGQAIVPDLIAVLNQGLSPAGRDDLRKALEERYAQLVAQSRKNLHAPVRAPQEKFVELYLGKLDTQYRVRAVQALAAIGGDRARAALEQAASQSDRDEVRSMARESLRKLGR
jgi:hypothetical protein